MKTVILAAGIGSRLQDVSEDLPKPLFNINGRSLLDYSLEALSKCGISNVTIVNGFMGEKIRSYLGNYVHGINIRHVRNNKYAETGSMHSLYCALMGREIEDTLVLDGDLVFDPRMIEQIIKDKRKNLAFLTGLCGNGEETYTTLDDTGRITYLSLNKKTDRNLVEKEDVYEFNGVSKFSQDFLMLMFDLHEKRVNKGREDSYYEECALIVAKDKPWFRPWYGLVGDSNYLAEVDRKEDIERAETLIEKIF
jgi:choline kinase